MDYREKLLEKLWEELNQDVWDYDKLKASMENDVFVQEISSAFIECKKGQAELEFDERYQDKWGWNDDRLYDDMTDIVCATIVPVLDKYDLRLED